MTIKIKKSNDKKTVYNITNLCASFDWSGTDKQVSRKLEFSVAHNPQDGDFPSVPVDVGDVAYFYNENKDCVFIGRITSAQNTSQPGVRQYVAMDYMNLLLKSKSAYRIKNKTPEWIAAKVAKDVGVKVGSIAKTKISIEKWLVESELPYNIILGAYTRAHEKNGKIYRLYMDGIKLCVSVKGESTGVKLTTKDSVTDTSVTRSTDGMINRVLIVDDTGKKIGEVKQDKSIKRFGIYQTVVKKEKGVNAHAAAKEQLQGVKQELTVDAIGDTRCVAGKSIKLSDAATGITGTFWITEDKHTWDNGIHKMTLKLEPERKMEEYQIQDQAATAQKTKDTTSKDNGWYWPLGSCSCYISSGYGYRDASIGGNAFHGGIDITGADISGAKIYAARSGTVDTAISSEKGYGKHVIIDHGSGFKTVYGHCSKLIVKEGQKVQQGQYIANVGSTGNSTGPHLHFEVRYKNAKKNPLNYVKKP